MDKPVVLIVTDSLGLPRAKPESVLHHETWPELLKQKFPGYNFVQLSFGAATIWEIESQLLGYYKEIQPKHLIIQCGIVDCAPRAITKTFFAHAKRKKWMTWFVLPILKRLKKVMTKVRNLSYTSEKEFRKCTETILANFQNSDIKFIEIAPAPGYYEKILPGITTKILKYNSILSKTNVSLPLDKMPKNGIMTDGHHLNKAGHQFVFEQIELN